jgi:hypothetical protein
VEGRGRQRQKGKGLARQVVHGPFKL